MPEYGLARGLAADLQFNDRINDLRYNEQMTKRIQAENAAKSDLFAQDLDFQNAANSHDNPIIKQFAQNQIKKIGEYVRNNPDWQTNVQKRAQLNLMKRELKDNPDLVRGVTSDTARKEYLKDLQEVAKNPQQHDVDAYNAIGKEWDNYIKYGNQNGEEAANKFGKQAFVYQKPRDFIDLNKAYQETGNSFKDMLTRPIKGGRNAYEEYANPESLNAVAMQMYNQNKRQFDVLAAKEGINPLEYIKTSINAHIPKKRDFGDYHLADQLAAIGYKNRLDNMNVPVNQSAYQEAFVNMPQGVVSPESLEQAYGSKPKHLIFSNNGSQQIDNTGNRVYYTGAHQWVQGEGGRRQKVVEVYSYLTPEQAKEKGIYDDGAWNPFKGEEITPEWNRNAELVTMPGEKDGEPKKMIKVTSLMPVELNTSYAGAFDQATHLSKSKLMAQTPNEGGGMYDGHQIGSVVKTNKGNYLVTSQGYVPQ